MAKKSAKGLNCTLSVKGMGSIRVRTLSVEMKMSVIAMEGEAKQRRAFYPIVTTSGSFSMVMAFVSYSERETFNRWIRAYISAVAAGTAPSGYMSISIPRRNFERLAVPTGEVIYGESVTDVGYTLTMAFGGASDPVEDVHDLSGTVSRFIRAKSGATTSKNFYPGQQVSGAESLEGTLFDRKVAHIPIPSPEDWAARETD